MTGIDESARDRKNALSSLMLSPATNIQFTRCSSSTKDGLANVGVGSMEDISELGTTSAAEWYEGIDNLAQLAGVTVSVISISGDENFRLENIGRVADLTAGHVDKIDPLKVAKNFAGINIRNMLRYCTRFPPEIRPRIWPAETRVPGRCQRRLATQDVAGGESTQDVAGGDIPIQISDDFGMD
eukprot:1114355_1